LPALPWFARVNGARVLPCGTTRVTSPASGITWVPSVDLPPRVNSRRDRSLGRASAPSARQGNLETRSALVVSHHLDGLLRAPLRNESGAGPTSGRTRSQVCCNLLPTGVRRVSAADVSTRRRCRRVPSAPRRVLATRSYPPKIPSPAAAPCHHGRCPRDVPSLAPTATTEALARTSSRESGEPRRPDELESAEADLHAFFLPAPGSPTPGHRCR
jgi:hypothetical protein